MMLTSEGMPTLRFGRLTATINTAHRPFVLETPVGRLVLTEYGSIGVSAFGNEGEIHVFDGAATLEPAWRSPDEESMPLKIEAGQSIRVQPGDDGELSITHHSAEPDYFAAQVSMESDGLAIPPAYVKAVKKAAPIGYWRFERDKWPNVPNEMGGRLACQVTGALGRANFQATRRSSLASPIKAAKLLSTDVIDESIHDSYSIEFWIKPSHYHVGAVVSLVGDTPMPSGIMPHGMLIELGGTGKIPTAVHHPGCIRFLHRSPAGNETQIGTSCYSKTALHAAEVAACRGDEGRAAHAAVHQRRAGRGGRGGQEIAGRPAACWSADCTRRGGSAVHRPTGRTVHFTTGHFAPEEITHHYQTCSARDRDKHGI